MSDYKSCDECGDRVWSGDIHYIDRTGQEVCEYCLDSINDDYRDGIERTPNPNGSN